MIEVSEISSLHQLGDHKEAWDRLLNKSETNVVYLTYEWTISCWQSFGGDSSPLILIAKQDDEIVGIVPLSITVQKVFGKRTRIVEFISTIWADYNDVIVKKDLKAPVLVMFFSYLFSIRDRWDVIRFDEIPNASSTIVLFEQLAKEQFWFYKIRNASMCPRLIIENHKDEIEKNLLRRKDFKYRYNWLERQGDLIYKDCESCEEVISVINTYFNCHIGRWDTTETKSLFYDPKNRGFFVNLVRNIFPAGYLKFSVLSLNDLAVGFCFGFQYNQMFIRYKSTFNNAFYKRSPGIVLLKFMIEEAILKKLYAIDYVRGTEGYKSEVSNNHQQNKCIEIYKNNSIRMRIAVRGGISRSRLVRWLGTKKAYLRFRRIIKEYRCKYGYIFPIKILQRLLSGVCMLNQSFLYAIDKQDFNEIVPKCPLEIRSANKNDVWLIASVYGYSEDSMEREEIEQSLERGDKCYIAFDRKNPINCSWIRRGQVIGLGEGQLYKLNLEPDEACIYHCFTSPVYRGMNIYSAVLKYISKECFAEGIKKIYICCNAKNIASQKGILKAGFALSDKIVVIELFKKKIGVKKLKLIGNEHS
ncbi:MAG: GNAT family N-acetyltransferase [Phycisphaerae bacterium]|jgi:CelD/BcsL family acetyltransferase involved in cellulose biosynthesis/RimJ/RimL family protein N-acetyltransferase